MSSERITHEIKPRIDGDDYELIGECVETVKRKVGCLVSKNEGARSKGDAMTRHNWRQGELAFTDKTGKQIDNSRKSSLLSPVLLQNPYPNWF